MDPQSATRTMRSRLFTIAGFFGLMWLWLTILVIASQGKIVGGVLSGILRRPFVGVFSNMALANWGIDFATASVSQLGMVALVTCLLAPLAEEVVFRGTVCHKWAGDGKGAIVNWWPIVGVSTLTFGFLHTMGYDGIVLQGVIGFLLAMLWFRNGPSQKWSYLSCVLAHGLYNLSVLGVMIVAKRIVTETLANEFIKRIMNGP